MLTSVGRASLTSVRVVAEPKEEDRVVRTRGGGGELQGQGVWAAFEDEGRPEAGVEEAPGAGQDDELEEEDGGLEAGQEEELEAEPE